MTTYRRQEQEPASDEITEVAPGVLRLQLPIELPGLGHVNCYALEDERGFALVDPGLPDEKSYNTLCDRLAAADIPLARVHTAIVTHSHFDHFGGVFRLREDTECDVLTHEQFRSLINEREANESEDSLDLELATDEELEAMRDKWRRPTPWGTHLEPPPISEIRKFATQGRKRRAFALPEPSLTVVDEEVVMLARREWVAVHTPGHTGDHVCLYDPVEGVLLSGDHVLPTITPHIGGMSAVADPLEQFFSSLRRMHELEGVSTVLPAHGHPFPDLGGRADEIIEHHLERLDHLREFAAEDLPRGTVHQFMQRLFKERSWGGMAESETYAHLEHLLIMGDATASTNDDGHKVYEL